MYGGHLWGKNLLFSTKSVTFSTSTSLEIAKGFIALRLKHYLSYCRIISQVICLGGKIIGNIRWTLTRLLMLSEQHQIITRRVKLRSFNSEVLHFPSNAEGLLFSSVSLGLHFPSTMWYFICPPILRGLIFPKFLWGFILPPVLRGFIFPSNSRGFWPPILLASFCP